MHTIEFHIFFFFLIYVHSYKNVLLKNLTFHKCFMAHIQFFLQPIAVRKINKITNKHWLWTWNETSIFLIKLSYGCCHKLLTINYYWTFINISFRYSISFVNIGSDDKWLLIINDKTSEPFFLWLVNCNYFYMIFATVSCKYYDLFITILE